MVFLLHNHGNMNIVRTDYELRSSWSYFNPTGNTESTVKFGATHTNTSQDNVIYKTQTLYTLNTLNQHITNRSWKTVKI